MRPFFLTTIPKSGTHLVTKFLALAGLVREDCNAEVMATALVAENTYSKGAGEPPQVPPEEAIRRFRLEFGELGPGHYAFHHAPFHPDLAAMPTVFVYRDPRDVAISMANHILRERTGPKRDRLEAISDPQTRVECVIEGWAPFYPLDWMVEPFRGWLEAPGVLVLRHSDLIGPAGGGSAERQVAAFGRLSQFIGLDADIPAICEQVYDRSEPGVGEGRVGQWRDLFTPDLHQAYATVMGDAAVRWAED
jgi:hypothetical protein